MRDVPSIAWIIAGVVLVLLVSLAGIVGARDRDLTRRIAGADSAAHEFQMRAVILNRDAKRAAARAEADRTHAAQSDEIADSLRRDLATLSARAAASSAKVDRHALSPDVLEALNDADAFRLAVTPAMRADSLDAAAWKSAAERSAHAYELQAEAYAEQGAALVARETEIRALKRQHAPRCGRTCGVAIGAGSVLLVRELGLALVQLLRGPR